MVTTRTTRGMIPSAIRAALTGVVCAGAIQVAAAQDLATGPRVRSTSAAIVEAIARGVEHSATFRGLVAAIDATDGLVYIDDGACRHDGVRACLLLSVTVAGPNRLLRIVVNLRRAPGCQLVEAIGHELQHAMEVLQEPGVRNDAQIYHLFGRLGRTGERRFETDDAMRTGSAVHREACRPTDTSARR